MRKQTGFTLIELIIVIVVLGILSGIAALSYKINVDIQKEAVAKANLRIIESSVILYRADNNGAYPEKILSTSGQKDGLDYYFDDTLNQLLRDPNEPYKYSLIPSVDKIVLRVLGPNSFHEDIIISK